GGVVLGDLVTGAGGTHCRYEHDTAPAAGAHVGQERLGHAYRGDDVGVVAAVPTLGIRRSPVSADGNAIVVDDDVDVVDRSAHVVYERRGSCFGTDVADHRMAPAAGVGEHAHGVVGLTVLDPVHENGRALGSEHSRDTRTRTAIRTRDERDPAVETEIHWVFVSRGHDEVAGQLGDV